MRRITLPALAAAATSLAATSLAATTALLAPAAEAISRGTADDGRHPMVGTMVAQDADGQPLWSCSGTLVSPTVFVTAGHCTSDDRGGSVPAVQVWFDEGPIETSTDFLLDPDDLWCQDDEGNRYDGYPCGGDAGAAEVHTHPQYDPSEFWRHDLGVVVLDREIDLPAGHEYATLPEQGAYDSWTSNRKQSFTAVGYGKQRDFGQGASKDEGPVERHVAKPWLVSVNSPSVGDYAMKVSGNANTGGSCSGDSGGPNFLAGTLEIAAVTSYGANGQTCSGPDGAYRLDGADDVAFLARFID